MNAPARSMRRTSEPQTIEFEIALPTPNRIASRFGNQGLVLKQRRATRRALELMAIRPELPCHVLLVRISSGAPDSDRACAALSAVRDEIARWAFGLPFETIAMKDGRPVLDKRGRIVMRAPRAPDGPSDPFEWDTDTLRTKERGRSACRIIFTPQGVARNETRTGEPT